MTDFQQLSRIQDVRDEIEVRLPASLVHLPIVRSVAVNIAMRADFDIDAISDLEMAVDEACSSLITKAAPESTLDCRFRIRGHEIGFAATVQSLDDDVPSNTTFGWRVLTTLTDTVEAWVEPSRDGDEQHLVHIELRKRRPVVQG